MTDVNVGEIIILGRISYFINRRTGPTSNLTYLCICVAESASENNCLNVKWTQARVVVIELPSHQEATFHLI